MRVASDPLRRLLVPSARSPHCVFRCTLPTALRRGTASRPAYNSLSGTVLMPMLPANAEFMNSSRITLAAYGSAMESMSALSALAMTSRQKRSIAPCRLAVAPEPCAERLSRVRRHRPHQRVKARASAILSASEKACAVISFGSPCSGAGSPKAQSRRAQPRPPPARLDHRHLAGPVDAVRDADASIEANEIRAAAKEHMLAVVDDLIDARMQIGTGAPAEVAAPLDELHAKARPRPARMPRSCRPRRRQLR